MSRTQSKKCFHCGKPFSNGDHGNLCNKCLYGDDPDTDRFIAKKGIDGNWYVYDRALKAFVSDPFANVQTANKYANIENASFRPK